MRICIHRGSKQIGGSCVEVESQGQRLLVDFGLPLDADENGSQYLPKVHGLDGGGPPVVTHADTPLTTPPNGTRTSDAKQAILADLLVGLPTATRREIIATMLNADRIAIARSLIHEAPG